MPADGCSTPTPRRATAPSVVCARRDRDARTAPAPSAQLRPTTLLRVRESREGSATMILPFDEAGQGQPVVLLHARPTDRTMWRAHLPLLAAAGVRAVAPDLPGHGDAATPRHDEAAPWADVPRTSRPAGTPRGLLRAAAGFHAPPSRRTVSQPRLNRLRPARGRPAVPGEESRAKKDGEECRIQKAGRRELDEEAGRRELEKNAG